LHKTLSKIHQLREQVVKRVFACETGRLGLVLTQVIPTTLKIVYAVSLAKRSALGTCAEDKDTVSGFYVNESKLTKSWRN